MTWLRVDDCFNDHPKVEALAKEPRTQGDALAVWLTMAVDCAHRQTDGEFSSERLQKCFPGWTARRRKSALDALVKVGLVDARGDGANFMRSWLEYNPSRASLLARASEDKRRRDKGRDNRWENATIAAPQNNRAPRSGDAAADGPVPVPVPVPITPKGVRGAQPPSSEVVELFDFWRTKTERAKSVLSDTRRKLIERSLKTHSLEDLKTSVANYSQDSWHVENSKLELEYILRDVGKIEAGLHMRKKTAKGPLPVAPEFAHELSGEERILRMVREHAHE